MKNEEVIYIPLLGDEKSYQELHPAINFFDDEVWVGFWLKTKKLDKAQNELGVYHDLWMWNGNELKRFYDLLKERNYIPKTKPMMFPCRISTKTLLNYKLSEDDVDVYMVYNKITYNKKLNTSYTHIHTFNSSGNDFLIHHIHIYTLEEIFEKIKYKFSYYLDTNEENIELISLWSMATYFFMLFDSFPYLYINGVKRSGKTTLIKLLYQVSFNAILTGSTTASSVFRLVDSVKATLLIDETDSLASARNKPELRQILLNGYKKGAIITRTAKDDGQKFNVEMFDAYSPKALVNIQGLEDTLEDRTIMLNLLRTARKEYSERVMQIDKDEAWQEIRDLLYISLVNYWKKVKEIYEVLENNTKLKNRDWELWKPIFTIAVLISDDLYHRMIKLAEKLSKEKEVEDVTEQWDMILIGVLNEMIDTDKWVFVSDIKEKMSEMLTQEERERLTTRWVGLALRRFGIKNKVRKREGIHYFIERKVIDELVKRYLHTDPPHPQDNRANPNPLNTPDAEPDGSVGDEASNTSRESLPERIKKAFNVILERHYESLKNEGFTAEELEYAKKTGLLMEVKPGWFRKV